MRKKDPRYQKFKARKQFRWGLKMNAVLLGCCFLLNYVGRLLEKERKQPEENEKQAEKERARREREKMLLAYELGRLATNVSRLNHSQPESTAEPPDAIDATRPR